MLQIILHNVDLDQTMHNLQIILHQKSLFADFAHTIALSLIAVTQNSSFELRFFYIIFL